MLRTPVLRVRASFNYLEPIHLLNPPELPFRYAYAPPNGRPLHNELLRSHSVEVRDIRQHPEVPGLDSTGFEVWQGVSTKFNAWENDERIGKEYYPETIELIKQKLGARSVVVFDHTIRRRKPGMDDKEDRAGQRQPVFRVHIDQTHEAGRNRVLRHLGEQEGERLLKGQVQIINVWRPLRGPVVDSPVGLCDIRSVVWEIDLVEAKLLYRDRTGSTYLVHHNDAHKWYYLSNMMPDEVVLIKCFDNLNPRAIAPHSG